MNWEESRLTSGRRSRLEMVCDVLRVISQGVEKPTRIMQISNLTWKDLLMYLEVLLRNQLITREAQGSRIGYRLTEKGERILDLYLKLKQESSVLGLDTLSSDRVSEAMKVKASGADSALTDSLVKKLRASGFVIGESQVIGKSGETHAFNVVATAKDGSKHGYTIVDRINEEYVLGLFVNQLDTDLHIHAYSKKALSPESRKLAESYSISAEQWEEVPPPGRPAPPGTLAFRGKNLLLEVDPSGNYEKIVKEFATQYKGAANSVVVFTWRGSPVYDALADAEGIQFFTLSTMVSYAKKGNKANETLVPQNDQAVLLDELSKMVKDKAQGNLLVIFDSLSDLIIAFGFEKSYEFMKNVNELVNEQGITSVLILKSRAHEERTMSLVRGLYRAHALYGQAGLKVTREA